MCVCVCVCVWGGGCRGVFHVSSSLYEIFLLLFIVGLVKCGVSALPCR